MIRFSAILFFLDAMVAGVHDVERPVTVESEPLGRVKLVRSVEEAREAAEFS